MPPKATDRRWHVSANGEVFGPYSLDDLRQMERDEQFFENDLVSPMGAEDWIRANEDPILRKLFFKSAPIPPVSSSPTTQGEEKRSGCAAPFMISAGVIFAIIILFIAMSSDQPKTPQQANCASDWHKCSDNAEIANNYRDWSLAQVRCKRVATEQAKYGTPQWPTLYFGSFKGGSDFLKTGTAILIEPDAQFQNGFGAMVHSRVVCTYDLNAKEVKNVSILPR